MQVTSHRLNTHEQLIIADGLNASSIQTGEKTSQLSRKTRFYDISQNYKLVVTTDN